MKSRFGAVLAAGLVSLGLALAACQKDAASLAARDHSGIQEVSAVSAPAQAATNSAAPDARDAPVPKTADGKPIWAANRQRTAEQNAQAAFQRNGAAFGAKDVDAFVAVAHAFTDHPARGVQRIERANGDVELYDPKANIFAVVTRDGAPRTLFKPDTGQAYWDQELAKAADAKGASTASGRSRSRTAAQDG